MTKTGRLGLSGLLSVLLWPVLVLGEGFDHGTWDTLLREHVVEIDGGASTSVDYAGMASDREELERYLSRTAAVEPARFRRWSEAEQLAFLINVYNARTVELILTAWPDIDSILELGGLLQSPWEREFFDLLGESRSLDELEHVMIRQRYDEPRIHFAVNCASIGCPALRAEAYAGERLDSQLEQATSDFLSDRSRNRLEGDVLHVSSIFDWYRRDFEQGFRGARTLAEFLAIYSESLGLAGADREALRRGDIDIRFLDYDWRLNGMEKIQAGGRPT